MIHRTSVSMVVALLSTLAVPVSSQTTRHCDLDSLEVFPSSQSLLIDQTWEATSTDGSGGIDTHKVPGASLLLPRLKVFSSIEVVDLKNGQFNTFFVNAEVLLSNELLEQDILGDWFDQIVLDPRYDWDVSFDHSFSRQLFKTIVAGEKVTVTVGLGIEVLAPPTHMIATTEGPLGRFEPFHSHPPEPTTIPVLTNSGLVKGLRWDQGGVIRPDFRQIEIDEDTDRFQLNTVNGSPNIVLLDLRKFIDGQRLLILHEGDETDRLVFLQPGCWAAKPISRYGQPLFDAGRASAASVSIFAGSRSRHPLAYNTFTTGVAREGNYRHLSADATQPIDEIDLRNQESDILVIRNDGRVRSNFPVLIHGDNGEDEVWLEGGWQIKPSDFGIVATARLGRNNTIKLQFAPGLKVGILDAPQFLYDPRLFELGYYPSVPDTVIGARNLLITREGLVNFSSQQLTDVGIVDMQNGKPNTIFLSPEIASLTRDRFRIHGDEGIDLILVEEMPEAFLDEDGVFTWLLKKPNDRDHFVSVSGISMIAENTLEQ